MKILIASTPVPGHLNPLLSIASLLVESGHEVAVQVNEDLRPAVEAAGYRFLSEIPNAQTSAAYYFDNYPERRQKPLGMTWRTPSRWNCWAMWCAPPLTLALYTGRSHPC
jgi:UDP:flavonoid glycosyltransferase YjiC (YdhE family)